METPIADFAEAYRQRNAVRMHMPGHKGRTLQGMEALDLTEIEGADVLYATRGIIRESENHAAELFGTARTVYSTEGSSLCIRAMLTLARMTAAEKGLPFRVLAGRNAHKTLMTAAALLDLEIDWLPPAERDGILSCGAERETVEEALRQKEYMAVYLTSPDYLGNRADIRGIAAVCRRFGVPLLTDNAHGAYLKFLEKDAHPIALGADICCDSAHKTLACLTGAAYLHIAHSAPASWAEQAEAVMALYASTSPSYLILASLDRMNARLAADEPRRIRETAGRVQAMKDRLRGRGWETAGDEPMKLTLRTKGFGWTGTALAEELSRKGIIPEFADPDYLVLMPSSETGEEDWRRTEKALDGIQAGPRIMEKPPVIPAAERVCGIREAMLSPRERVALDQAEGRVLADPLAGCPPAVPPVIAGERISREAVRCLRYYGLDACMVMK